MIIFVTIYENIYFTVYEKIFNTVIVCEKIGDTLTICVIYKTPGDIVSLYMRRLVTLGVTFVSLYIKTCVSLCQMTRRVTRCVSLRSGQRSGSTDVLCRTHSGR